MLRRVIASTSLAVLATSAPALAGGFEYNENGSRALGRAGAFVARADDPMAIHYNPAGLVTFGGHQLLLSMNLNKLDLRYTRTGIDDLIASPDNPSGIYDSATVENEEGWFPAPALAWGFGAERWGVGFGVYGPGAYGKRKFPADGPQRFMLTDEDVLLGYVTASGAFSISKVLSVGASVQYVMMPTARFGLTVDAAPSSQNDQKETSPYLAQSSLDLSDYAAFAAIFGVHFRPSPRFEAGISTRPFPVDLNPDGKVTLNFPAKGVQSLYDNGVFGLFEDDGVTRDESVTLNLKLAPWIRGGARYIHLSPGGDEVFDIELDVVYERWSVLENYEVVFGGKLKLGNPETNPLQDVAPVKLPKRYNDTVAVRLGGDWNVLQNFLTLRGGAFFETAAVPARYTNLDFTNFERLGGALGATLQLGPVDLSVAYQAVFQPDREVSVDQAQVRMERPLSEIPAPAGWDEATQGEYQGIVVNAGKYETFYQTISASLGVHF